MTSVFCLLALNFIWIFCSALVQIVIGLQTQYFVFSLLPPLLSILVCCTSSTASLICFLNFQPLSHLEPSVSWYHKFVLRLEPQRGVKNRFAFGRVFSLKRYVFHLFLSYFRYFSRALASSFRKQLVFVHLPGWNQMSWPTLRAAQLVVCILHPRGPWLLSVPALSSPNSLPDKDCTTGKHCHTVHGKGIIINVQGVSETFPLCSLVSLLLPAYTW